jgi:ribosomal protein S18 acetylase RimI-like enzyme
MEVTRLTELSRKDAEEIANNFPLHQFVAGNVRKFFEEENNILLIAKKDSTIVGITVAYYMQRLDKPNAQIFLDSIDVLPKNFRQGIGTAMIEKLKEVGRTRGATELWVLTNRSNEAAMALYASTGGVQKDNDVVMFDYTMGSKLL